MTKLRSLVARVLQDSYNQIFVNGEYAADATTQFNDYSIVLNMSVKIDILRFPKKSFMNCTYEIEDMMQHNQSISILAAFFMMRETPAFDIDVRELRPSLHIQCQSIVPGVASTSTPFDSDDFLSYLWCRFAGQIPSGMVKLVDGRQIML